MGNSRRIVLKIIEDEFRFNQEFIDKEKELEDERRKRRLDMGHGQ